jgi:uracil-DNA glycosylase
MSILIHPPWHSALSREYTKPYWEQLNSFVDYEYTKNLCFPERENIFRAFDLVPFDQVKVVIL